MKKPELDNYDSKFGVCEGMTQLYADFQAYCTELEQRHERERQKWNDKEEELMDETNAMGDLYNKAQEELSTLKEQYEKEKISWFGSHAEIELELMAKKSEICSLKERIRKAREEIESNRMGGHEYGKCGCYECVMIDESLDILSGRGED